MNAYLVILTVEMGFVHCAIILAYSVQVLQPTIANLVQTLFKLKDNIQPHHAFVQINILMILKISFANPVHLLVILARVIKIHAINA